VGIFPDDQINDSENLSELCPQPPNFHSSLLKSFKDTKIAKLNGSKIVFQDLEKTNINTEVLVSEILSKFYGSEIADTCLSLDQ
jgi:hypothetical protein